MTRHRYFPLALFLALVLPLSWYGFLLRGSTPEDSGINPLGPLVAALIAAAVSRQFREFLRRILTVRATPTVYAVALGLPLLLCVGSIAIGALATGAPLPAAQAQAQLSNFVDGFLIAFLFIALGEEPGWRGLLFPSLARWTGPVMAALLICPIWAIWHYPLFGTEFTADMIPPFLVGLVGASFVLAWLTLRTRGGVLPAMLCHAMTNGIGSSYLFPLFDGNAAVTIRWVNALLWLGAGGLAGLAMHRAGRSGGVESLWAARAPATA